jgi:hypothetical protein
MYMIGGGVKTHSVHACTNITENKTPSFRPKKSAETAQPESAANNAPRIPHPSKPHKAPPRGYPNKTHPYLPTPSNKCNQGPFPFEFTPIPNAPNSRKPAPKH